jgi:hypothetical protein
LYFLFYFIFYFLFYFLFCFHEKYILIILISTEKLVSFLKLILKKHFCDDLKVWCFYLFCVYGEDEQLFCSGMIQ